MVKCPCEAFIGSQRVVFLSWVCSGYYTLPLNVEVRQKNPFELSLGSDSCHRHIHTRPRFTAMEFIKSRRFTRPRLFTRAELWTTLRIQKALPHTHTHASTHEHFLSLPPETCYTFISQTIKPPMHSQQQFSIVQTKFKSVPSVVVCYLNKMLKQITSHQTTHSSS